jgi:hypothetical protein
MFGRRKPVTALDRLTAASWRCAYCDDLHEGIFDLAVDSPDFWTGPEVLEPNSALRTEGDFLSEDFCVLGGEDFFVRCVLEVPVHGLARKFGFGTWSTLSRANFDIYVEGFDDSRYSDMGPWTGWFSNRLKTFPDTLSQPCWVHPQLGNQRPVIRLADEDHPLAVAQEEGIEAERLLEIYAAYGHSPA